MDSEKYNNQPPKDIMNAIWGACFDYKNFDKKVFNITIRDRIYEAWQRMSKVISKDLEEAKAKIAELESKLNDVPKQVGFNPLLCSCICPRHISSINGKYICTVCNKPL